MLFAPIAHGKALLPVGFLENLRDLAITQAEYVHAERFGAGERFVQRCGAVDANEQRGRLEAERTHRGSENAVALADRAGRNGIDRRRDVTHRRTEGLEQFVMGWRGIAHARSMGRAG